jgi:hypothetical protein
MPTPSHHLELGQYMEDTAVIDTSHSALLLPCYLETYLSRLENWLLIWRIAINIAKSTAMLFAKMIRHIQKSRPAQFLREPIQWVETA